MIDTVHFTLDDPKIDVKQFALYRYTAEKYSHRNLRLQTTEGSTDVSRFVRSYVIPNDNSQADSDIDEVRFTEQLYPSQKQHLRIDLSGVIRSGHWRLRIKVSSFPRLLLTNNLYPLDSVKEYYEAIRVLTEILNNAGVTEFNLLEAQVNRLDLAHTIITKDKAGLYIEALKGVKYQSLEAMSFNTGVLFRTAHRSIRFEDKGERMRKNQEQLPSAYFDDIDKSHRDIDERLLRIELQYKNTNAVKSNLKDVIGDTNTIGNIIKQMDKVRSHYGEKVRKFFNDSRWVEALQRTLQAKDDLLNLIEHFNSQENRSNQWIGNLIRHIGLVNIQKIGQELFIQNVLRGVSANTRYAQTKRLRDDFEEAIALNNKLKPEVVKTRIENLQAEIIYKLSVYITNDVVDNPDEIENHIYHFIPLPEARGILSEMINKTTEGREYYKDILQQAKDNAEFFREEPEDDDSFILIQIVHWFQSDRNLSNFSHYKQLIVC